jgi:GNAT superfamily N-acetyltransferase
MALIRPRQQQGANLNSVSEHNDVDATAERGEMTRAEIDSAYAQAYAEHPLDEPDEWGDLGSFLDAARASASVEIIEVDPGHPRWENVLELADRVLDQRRYLVKELPHVDESHVLGAFDDGRCIGFLRFTVQVIGAEEGRPPVTHDGVRLREGFVEAFGVDPDERRHGIGSALQQGAIDHAKAAGCWQMRSRSPITSTENYALKLAAGYVLMPSEENDSYYFLLRL